MGFLQIANSLAKGFRKSRKWCHVFITDRAENAESLLRKWTEKDLKTKDYDIFISIYSASGKNRGYVAVSYMC
ncbi:hypothetical protein B0F90DRAFT_1728893 [Multifurca ochricompacta]|uniref:Uncharacterized protein n=1 Tax=Multifurca ochricompacta TaxID=376703 RepID=A0AAD4M1X2_9AGAM|nr:hypothetical protein B0F90DRAFT_1728893 [Multifurca ochricompacta]